MRVSETRGCSFGRAEPTRSATRISNPRSPGTGENLGLKVVISATGPFYQINPLERFAWVAGVGREELDDADHEMIACL